MTEIGDLERGSDNFQAHVRRNEKGHVQQPFGGATTAATSMKVATAVYPSGDNSPGSLRNSTSSPALSQLQRRKIDQTLAKLDEREHPEVFDLRAPLKPGTSVSRLLLDDKGKPKTDADGVPASRSVPDLQYYQRRAFEELVELEMRGRVAHIGINTNLLQLRRQVDTQLTEQQRRRSTGSIHLLEQSPWTIPLLVAVFQGILGAFLYGYNVTVLNVPHALWVDTGKIHTTADNFSVISQTEFNSLNAIFCAGALFGALVAAPISNKLGRKRAIVVMDLFFIAASIVMFTCTGYATFLTGRLLVGLGCGMASAILPTYLGEIAPVVISGTIGTGFQLILTSGIVVSGLLGKKNWLGGPKLWRYLVGLGIFPPVFQILTYWSFPESPKWLMQEGRETECRNVLKSLRQSADVDDEIRIMKATSNRQKTTSRADPKTLPAAPANWSNDISDIPIADEETGLRQQLITSPPSSSHSGSDFSRKRTQQGLSALCSRGAIGMALVIAVTLQILQQFSGINSVFFFSASTLENANVDPWLGSLIVNVSNVAGVIVAVPLIDRLGRRLLLFVSLVGMIASSALLTAAFKEIANGSTSPWWEMGSVVYMCIYVFTFELGLGPIPWLIVAEISPTSHRSYIMSAGCVFNWGSNLLIAQFGSSVVHAAQYIPFMAVCAAGIVFIRFFVPETKGLSLVQVQKLLVNG